MNKQRKKRESVTRTTSKNTYLKGILTRHETEYMKILELVNEHNLTHERGIGFWSLARMIFPVIETVAKIVGKNKEAFLKEDLHVPFGYLVWDLYRHALTHSDELRYSVYKEKHINWAIHLGNEGVKHMVAKQLDDHSTTIHISVPKLYKDLHGFLVTEVTKEDFQIKIQVGVHFPDPEEELKSELEELYSKY